MSISSNLKKLLIKKGYTIVKLSEEVGVTTANLSKLANNKVSEVKLETINKICKVLKCTPGDLFEYKDEEKKKIIPMFLDCFGGTDLFVSNGIDSIKEFFKLIIKFQKETNIEIKIIIMTDIPFEAAKAKYILFNKLAESYGLHELVYGAVLEHCGFFINNDNIITLNALDSRIIEKRADIEEIATEYNSCINSKYVSLCNLVFDKKISRSQLEVIREKIEKAINCDEIIIESFYDSYGIELDIMNKNHNKANAVLKVTKMLQEEYDIIYVFTGGAPNNANLGMYYNSKNKLAEMGYNSCFIASDKMDEFEFENDENMLEINLSSYDGLKELIDTIYSKTKIGK